MTKRLGGRTILDGVSFSVEEAEFFVLLGPSGCGKSTLLRLICGLETPDEGRVLVDGRDITRLPPRERNLGMVFQDYGLYPNMNVYQNIAYGLEARGVGRSEIDARIPPAAEKLGLTELLRRNINDLSGGEQQRVALARAMVKDADAYLFDEPLSNLDPKLRHKARRDIVAVHREKRKPSIYVTHDQAEAFAMGDRIAVMHQGQLQQIGSAEALLTAPANLFVAGFVGSPPANLIDGALAGGDGAYQFVGDGFALAISPERATGLASYRTNRVIAGIRPSALVMPGHADFAVDALNLVSGAIEFVEPLLGETVVSLKIGPRTSLTAALADVDGDGLTPGATLTLAVDPAQVMLFDPQTQAAL
jgi:ABC-type sugar transport system ATPase subunit